MLIAIALYLLLVLGIAQAMGPRYPVSVYERCRRWLRRRQIRIVIDRRRHVDARNRAQSHSVAQSQRLRLVKS